MNKIETTYSFQGVWDTAIGGRPDNQDDCGTIDTNLGLLVVLCDGMGGGPGGRTASSILKNVFGRTVAEAEPESNPETVLLNAAEIANASILQMTQAHQELIGMGSTLVAVLFHHTAAYVVHCGDSRLYQFRGHKKLFRTNDHSLVGAMVRTGSMTEEQARMSPQSNVLMRYMGNKEYENPDICAIPYKHGDRFVLCSDGVWGVFPEKDLFRKLTSNEPIASICQNLQSEIDIIGAANPESHHDNHTLIIVDVQSDSQIKDSAKNTLCSKRNIAFLCGILGLLAIGSIILISGNDPNKSGKTDSIDNMSPEFQNLDSTKNSETIPQLTNDIHQSEIRSDVNNQIRRVKQRKREKDIEDSINKVKREDSIRNIKRQDSSKKVNKAPKTATTKETNSTKKGNKKTIAAAREIKVLLNDMLNTKSSKPHETVAKLDRIRNRILKKSDILKSDYPDKVDSLNEILQKKVNDTYVIILVTSTGRPTDDAKTKMKSALKIIESIPGVN